MKYLMMALVIVCFSYKLNAQQATVDPALAAAIGIQTGLETNNANKTHDFQKKIKEAQAAITLETNRLKAMEKKLFNALKNVSGAVRNAYQVIECGKIVGRVVDNQTQMVHAAQPNPIALAFALKFEQQIIAQTTKLGLSIEALILKAGDEKVLMDAGQRTQLLNDVLYQLRIIEALSWRAFYTVRSVVAQGIINSLNPFQNYVNRDAQIVNNIMNHINF